jgi:hypothetical protein
VKIDINITSIETTGDQLRVRGQGSQPRSAKWRRMNLIDLTIDDSDAAKGTFRVGRSFTVEIKPKRSH